MSKSLTSGKKWFEKRTTRSTKIQDPPQRQVLFFQSTNLLSKFDVETDTFLAYTDSKPQQQRFVEIVSPIFSNVDSLPFGLSKPTAQKLIFRSMANQFAKILSEPKKNLRNRNVAHILATDWFH